MFARNPQPENLAELMGKFRDTRNIHDFVKAQMVAGTKLALIFMRICNSKLDLDKLVDHVFLRLSKRRMNIDRHNAAAAHVAERIIDELLRLDATFFQEYRYDDATREILSARENIDRLI
jgi:hypothetical protein